MTIRLVIGERQQHPIPKMPRIHPLSLASLLGTAMLAAWSSACQKAIPARPSAPGDMSPGAQIERLQKGCDTGSAEDCRELGVMFAKGNVMAQDNGRAMALFRKS